MFTFNSTSNPADPNANADLLYALIREYRYAAALLLIPSLEKSERADVLYNIAILLGYISERERATQFIDRALIAMKKIAPKNNFMRPENYTFARALEIKCKSYLVPMSMDFINNFPDLAREDILIFGAYNANMDAKLEKRDAYLAQLVGAEFDEFKKEIKGELNG